jgi:hypothetical protein
MSPPIVRSLKRGKTLSPVVWNINFLELPPPLPTNPHTEVTLSSVPSLSFTESLAINRMRYILAEDGGSMFLRNAGIYRFRRSQLGRDTSNINRC